jgi:hypothetical protein
MKIKVAYDRTERTISLDVSGADPMTRKSQEYRQRVVSFLPDHVNVRINDGELSSVSISGPVLKKDGTPGQARRDSESWYSGINFRLNAPEWLVQVVSDAAQGVTQWTR